MFHPRPLAALAFAVMLPTLLGAAPLAPEGRDPVQTAETICPTAILELIQEAPDKLGVTLFAPCQSGERVVLEHAGLVLELSVSDLGGLYAALPLVDARQPVRVTFEDGLRTEALLPAQDPTQLQQVSARW